jgi:hypothetical protein
MAWGTPFEAMEGAARLAVLPLEDEERRRVTGLPPQGTVRMLGEADCEVGIHAAEAEEGYTQPLSQFDHLPGSLSQATQQAGTVRLHRSNLEGDLASRTSVLERGCRPVDIPRHWGYLPASSGAPGRLTKMPRRGHESGPSHGATTASARS